MPDDKGTATAEGKPDAKVEGKSESDIDKMRSTYDKREAQLRKELDASREDIAGLTLQLGEIQARARSAEFTVSADEDPEKLVERLKALNEEKEKLSASFEAYKRDAWPYVQEAYAARKLLSEEQREIVGKGTERLKTAKSTAEFDAILSIMEKELDIERRERELAEKGAVDSKVDGGRTAARTDVKSEIAAFDPYDPESQRKWGERRRELKDKALGG